MCTIETWAAAYNYFLARGIGSLSQSWTPHHSARASAFLRVLFSSIVLYLRSASLTYDRRRVPTHAFLSLECCAIGGWWAKHHISKISRLHDDFGYYTAMNMVPAGVFLFSPIFTIPITTIVTTTTTRHFLYFSRIMRSEGPLTSDFTFEKKAPWFKGGSHF